MVCDFQIELPNDIAFENPLSPVVDLLVSNSFKFSQIFISYHSLTSPFIIPGGSTIKLEILMFLILVKKQREGPQNRTLWNPIFKLAPWLACIISFHSLMKDLAGQNLTLDGSNSYFFKLSNVSNKLRLLISLLNLLLLIQLIQNVLKVNLTMT